MLTTVGGVLGAAVFAVGCKLWVGGELDKIEVGAAEMIVAADGISLGATLSCSVVPTVGGALGAAVFAVGCKLRVGTTEGGELDGITHGADDSIMAADGISLGARLGCSVLPTVGGVLGAAVFDVGN